MAMVAAWATTALASAIAGGATTAAGAAAATAIASTIVSVGGQIALAAASSAATMLLTPKQRAEGSSTAFRLDTDAGIPFAFGTVGVGGVLAYRKSFGATNRYQALVSTLSGAGPIKAFVSFAADDEVTTFGANDVATSGDHSGAMWLQRKLGTQPQTNLTSPTGLEGSVTAPGWTSAHDMSGRACVMWTLFENSKMTEFKGGVPKPLHVIEGKYGWDPRLDSTYPGGSGSCRLLTPSTWVWITNPALAALNWSIGMWEGNSGGGLYGVPYACSLVGGIGSSIDGIDVAAFVNAANIADANGWTIAAYPSTKDDKFSVLANMLQAAGAMPARKAGKISCVVFGEEQASVVTVTAADTSGPVEVALGQSRLERINTVLPRYYSSAHRWEMTQASPVSDAAWVSEDGGKRSRGLDYPYVPDADQAAQLAYYDIANAREPISGTVPFKPHMRRIEPGDCFTFDEPGFLLDGVKVKCLRRSYDPMTGGVRITFRQETDAKHAAALGETGTAPDPTVPDTPYPGPWPADDAVYGTPGSGGGVAGDLAFLDTVAAAQIDAGAVTTSKIAASAVTATEIATGAVTTAKIAAGAVTATEIGTGAVTAGKLGSDAVTSAKVLAGAITPVYAALTTGTVNWTASAAEKDLQTVSSVVVTRGKVIIRASFTCDLNPQSSASVVGILRLYRAGSEIVNAQTTQQPVATLASSSNYVFSKQWVLDFIDDPGAGTYTYKIAFDPGHTADGDIRRRFMSVTPMEG